MPRIFKMSKFLLKLYVPNADKIQDLKLFIYTDNYSLATEISEGIKVEGNIVNVVVQNYAVCNLNDGIINYIAKGNIEGREYIIERQSNYYLKSPSDYTSCDIIDITEKFIDGGEGIMTLKASDFGVDGFGSVKIDATEYGEEKYDVGYDAGKVDGYDEGYNAGEVEQKSKLTNITISENGTYTREDGYNSVVVNVPDLNGDYQTGYDEGYERGIAEGGGGGVPSKIDVAEYGIKFANSPLTEIPEIFEFSNVRDYSYMFTNCKNLIDGPIGDSIDVDGSGDYAFYGSNIKVPSNIHINTNTSTINMIGGGSFTTTDEYALDIFCDNFPFNIINYADYDGYLNITLGERYNPFTDGPYEEEYQLFKDFDGYFISIRPQPDQDLKWLLQGCTAETIILGDGSISFNDDDTTTFLIDNCEELTLEGDYSNYGWRTTNGERFYTEYRFFCRRITGCHNLKGNFKFQNADTDIDSIIDFIHNIGPVPVEDGCRIWLPTNFDGLLTDVEIDIITNKGYTLYFG